MGCPYVNLVRAAQDPNGWSMVPLTKEDEDEDTALSLPLPNLNKNTNLLQ